MITIETKGLCAADVDYLQELVIEIEAYAHKRLGNLDIDVEEFAKRECRLPSLRGHLPAEERPYIRLILVQPGASPLIEYMLAGQLQRQQLAGETYIVWTEDRGKQEFFMAREDRDKYGTYDHRYETLPPEALVTSQLGLDATLEELLGAAYLARFGAEYK